MGTIFLTCLLALPLQAADDAMSVRSLVRELGGLRRAERDDAERRLIELGPAALEYLPEPAPGDSDESALRLNRVRQTLLRERVAGSMRASRVTVDVRDAPLPEVLTLIERQTGNKLIDYRRQFGQQADELSVTLKLQDVSFWQAVDRLCAVSGLTTYAFAGEDGLALVARTAGETISPEASSHVFDGGAFRLSLPQVSASRNLETGEADLQLNFEVAWEPRLKPLFLTLRADVFHAVDDSGRELQRRNPQLVQELPPQGKAAKIEAAVSFVSPTRSVASLRSVRGAFHALLTADMHTFRFQNLTDDRRQQHRAAAATVGIDRIRQFDNLLEIPVSLRYEHPANALESHRAWFYKNPAFLESADGKRIAPGSTELARQSDGEIRLNFMFVDPGDAAKLSFVYQTPADLVSLPIDFEFRDVPLP